MLVDPATLDATSAHALNGKFYDFSTTESGLRFPLKQGNSWTDAFGIDVMRSFSMGLKVESGANVGGMTSVAGPAGTVDAVHVKHLIAPPNFEEAKAHLVTEFEEEGVTVNKFDVSLDMQADTYYAPSLHNVVRQEFAGSESLDVDISYKGERIAGTVHADFLVVVALKQVSLETISEVPIETILGGKPLPPLPDPDNLPVPTTTGTSTSSTGGSTSPGSLTLSGVPNLPNAATAPSYTVRAYGSGGVDATKATIDLVGPTGELVAQSSNGTLHFTVSGPGTYQLTAAASDANGKPANAKASFTANYLTEAPFDCGTLNVGTTLPCKPITIPMAPGRGSLTVVVARTPIATEPGQGTASLRDPSGTVATATLQSNAAILSAQVHEHDTTGPWSVTYTPTAGVNEKAKATIVLTYEATTNSDGPATGEDQADSWSELLASFGLPTVWDTA